MNSVTTEQFRQLYTQAPLERRRKIRRAYQLWQENPAHPSLRFKKVHTTLPIYSARFDLVLGERPHQHSPICWPALVVRHGWEMDFQPHLFERQYAELKTEVTYASVH